MHQRRAPRDPSHVLEAPGLARASWLRLATRNATWMGARGMGGRETCKRLVIDAYKSLQRPLGCDQENKIVNILDTRSNIQDEVDLRSSSCR